MRILHERWYSLHLRTRILCWSLGSCLMFLGAYLALVRPTFQPLLQLEAKRNQLILAETTLWRSAAQPHFTLTEPDAAASLPFSPLDFQAAGVRLVHWLPDAKGGALTLDAEWMQIPFVFERLARCGMNVSAFSVEPGESTLQLVVQVENRDAN